jgi:Fe-S-cluster containining protein
MSSQGSRRHLSQGLAGAAAAYQREVVIPHCAECSKPCCRLDPLVLELDWVQLKALWQIEESRRTFDRRLRAGEGPEEIRAADGLYFAHGKVCPAYDEAGRSCRVYGQDLKPAGCSDFPVYEDGGAIIADLRCEAVDLAALVSWLTRAVGSAYRIVEAPNKDFPFLVTLMVKRVPGADASR